MNLYVKLLALEYQRAISPAYLTILSSGILLTDAAKNFPARASSGLPMSPLPGSDSHFKA